MIIVVVWDYFVVSEWSNLIAEEGQAQQKSDVIKYYSDAIQNYLILVAILIGIELK